MSNHKRFFAFLDILGFKNKVKRMSLESLASEVEALILSSSLAHVPFQAADVRTNVKKQGTFRPHKLHFSDSIVLWSDPVAEITPDMAVLDAMQNFSTGMMFSAVVSQIVFLGFLHDFPLRAGVAFGQLYVNESGTVILGPALIDAYELEQAQDWVGAAFHSSVPLDQVRYHTCAIDYPVPLKRGSEVNCAAALDWTYPAAYPWPESQKNSNKELFEAALRAYIDAAPDETIRTKYLQTKRFYDERVKQLDNSDSRP